MARANATVCRVITALWAFVITLTGGLGDARAGESSRLAYLRAAGAEQCPDEQALRLAVAVRLGYDPFVAWAKTTVHAEVARAGRNLRARVYIAGEDGRARGSREIVAPPDDCTKLLAAVALAISIAIDPMSANAVPSPASTDSPSRAASAPSASEESTNRLEAASKPELAATLATAPKELPQAVDQKDEPASVTHPDASASSARLHLGAGALASSGTAPNLAFGLSASARLNWPHVSLGLEGRYDLPASASADFGTGVVRSTLLLLSVEPCFRLSPVSLCGLASIGSLHAWGSGVAVPMDQTTLYWGGGGRAAFEWPVWGPMLLRAHADLVGNATRVTLTINNVDVWTAPALAAAVGVGAVARVW
jgi:hypothetical protein